MKITTNLTPTQKSHIVRTILADLPEWFGLPESTQAYVEEAAELSMWAMTDEETGEAAGFLTLKKTAPQTAEIHCMGVRKADHRKGVGRALFTAMLSDAGDAYRLLQVKTVAEGRYEAYDRTIAFYRSLGFVDLEVFPALWDPWNPCLILVYAMPA